LITADRLPGKSPLMKLRDYLSQVPSAGPYRGVRVGAIVRCWSGIDGIIGTATRAGIATTKQEWSRKSYNFTQFKIKKWDGPLAYYEDGSNDHSALDLEEFVAAMDLTV